MKTLSYAAVGLLGLSALTLSIIERAEDKWAAVHSPQVVAIGQMSVDRAAHQATLLQDGRVLVTGGCAGRGCDRVLSSVELFDPATSSFSTVGWMKTNHDLGTRLVDGRVLVTGGQGGAGEILALAEIIGFLPAGRDMPVLALRKQTYSLCGRRRRPE